MMRKIQSEFPRKRNVHIGEGSGGTSGVVWRELRDRSQRRDVVNVSNKLTIKVRMLTTLAMVIVLFQIKRLVQNRIVRK